MQVIIYKTDKGNVAVTVPTGELPIEEVLVKDCPVGAIIVDNSELPADNEFFDAWELVDGKVVVNLDKKNAMILEKESAQLAKESALAKLAALGLTQDEVKALVG
jgi:hypothetical protein